MSATLEEIAVETGRRIKEHRHSLGWSQERLAREAGGLSKETVRRAEAGKAIPDWATLEALAEALDVELNRLVGLSGEVGGTRASLQSHSRKPTSQPFLAAVGS